MNIPFYVMTFSAGHFAIGRYHGNSYAYGPFTKHADAATVAQQLHAIPDLQIVDRLFGLRRIPRAPSSGACLWGNT